MEHLRADVEEMLFRLAEQAEHDSRLRARLITGMKAVMRAAVLEVRWRGSDRLLRALEELAVRWARWRAPRLREALEIDPTNMGDLGRIQDWEDRVLGVTGHWVERAEKTATKHETACPFADIARLEPRICTQLVHRLETETFRALSPSYRLVPLTRLLSKGDSECVFWHELR